MRVFSFVMVAVVVGLVLMAMVVVAGCTVSQSEPIEYGVYVDKQWNKRLIMGTRVVEDEVGFALTPDSPINKIPAKCTIYVYPKTAILCEGTMFEEEFHIYAVSAVKNGYYIEGERVGSVMRDTNAEVGRDSKEPKIAARYSLSISPDTESCNNLFMISDLVDKSNTTWKPLILVQVVR